MNFFAQNAKLFRINFLKHVDSKCCTQLRKKNRKKWVLYVQVGLQHFGLFVHKWQVSDRKKAINKNKMKMNQSTSKSQYEQTVADKQIIQTE